MQWKPSAHNRASCCFTVTLLSKHCSCSMRRHSLSCPPRHTHTHTHTTRIQVYCTWTSSNCVHYSEGVQQRLLEKMSIRLVLRTTQEEAGWCTVRANCSIMVERYSHVGTNCCSSFFPQRIMFWCIGQRH